MRTGDWQYGASIQHEIMPRVSAELSYSRRWLLNFSSTDNRNGSLIPITLGIYKYIGNNTTQWNSIMATAVVASVPAAVLLVVAQRYVAAGVTAGAIKD